jgi:hypothetical protein
VTRSLERALLAGLACSALNAVAQTCTVCGEVRAIREVNAAPAASAQQRAPAAVGSPSALDTGPVIGTVARFEFDRDRPDRPDNSWHLGAAGTPEMQQRLGETYYELTVVMDGGERRTVQRRDASRFYVGQRVALRSGELEPR